MLVYVAMSADLIHNGHINILKEASKYGRVVVGLLSDKAIASYKRLPFMSLEKRKEIIQAIKYVDEVVIQDTLSYETNLRKLRPNYVVHGDDWKVGVQAKTRENVVKVLKEIGGELIEPKYTEGISSTALNEAARGEGISTAARAKLLRRLLEAKNPLRVLEAHSPLSALIAQNTFGLQGDLKVEFDAIWSSSLTDSTLRGKPDIEALDLSVRLKTINEIFDVSSKPLIYDADTGGKIEHFGFTVRALERIGVSALVIEDKIGLKKNSLLGNEVKQEQDSIENFSGKISVGKRAQITSDFMIYARIESLILEKGMEDALRRAHAYVEAGADGIMIHSRHRDGAEIFSFLKKFRESNVGLPIIVVPTSFYDIKAEELGEAGANIIIYANHMLRASYPAMSRVAKSILDHDRSKEAEPDCMNIKDILKLIPGTI